MSQSFTKDQPLDTDVNLGGASPQDYIAASQKATKTYVDNKLATQDIVKVSKLVASDGTPDPALAADATGAVSVAVTLALASGAAVNEFSTDGTLAGNSDSAVPTEKAVKTYADLRLVCGSGTSFPGSPATNDKYFRTDLGWLCYYDGTRWLTDFELSIPIPSIIFTASTAKALGSLRTDYAPYITRVKTNYYVGSPNNGTNYWALTWRGINGGYTAATTLRSFNTSGASASTWTEDESAPATNTPTNRAIVDFNIAKTLAPGNIEVIGNIFFKLIVT